jgi:hypothetical protein
MTLGMQAPAQPLQFCHIYEKGDTVSLQHHPDLDAAIIPTTGHHGARLTHNLAHSSRRLHIRIGRRPATERDAVDVGYAVRRLYRVKDGELESAIRLFGLQSRRASRSTTRNERAQGQPALTASHSIICPSPPPLTNLPTTSSSSLFFSATCSSSTTSAACQARLKQALPL